MLLGYIISILSIGHALGQDTARIELVEFNQSACDISLDPYRLKPRIISLGHSRDTLAIEIGFAATCCSDYVPRIQYSADTLYISYTAKGDPCACVCCYSFNHKIKGINSSKLTVKLHKSVIELSDEKYRTYPPTFVIVRGDTLNRKDKYGLKQGLWIDERAIQKIEGDISLRRTYDFENIFQANEDVHFYRYEDDVFHNWGHLYLTLKIKDEYNSRTKVRQEFYKNGQIKRECRETVAGKSTDCQQWEWNGQEIKYFKNPPTPKN
jgi:hypothetical protein